MNMYVLKSICSLYGTLSSCLFGNLGQNTTLGSPKEQPSDPHDKSRNRELHFLDMDSDSFKPAAGYDMLVVVPIHEPQETVY